jgi:hypothetical protein
LGAAAPPCTRPTGSCLGAAACPPRSARRARDDDPSCVHCGTDRHPLRKPVITPWFACAMNRGWMGKEPGRPHADGNEAACHNDGGTWQVEHDPWRGGGTAMMRMTGFVPAARSSGLVVTESAGVLLVHDRERRATHHLDAVTATIWKSCDGWRTVSDLGRSCACVLGSPVSDDTAIETVARLERAGLLEQPVVPGHGRQMRTGPTFAGGEISGALPATT